MDGDGVGIGCGVKWVEVNRMGEEVVGEENTQKTPLEVDNF